MDIYEKNDNITSSKDWATITPPQCFSQGIIKLLETNTLKDITLSQLSKECGYGRATFYRYFKDVYDLLAYCWTSFGLDFNMAGNEGLEPNQWALVMFRRLYVQLEPSGKTLIAIRRNNTESDAVWCSLRRYIQDGIFQSSKKAFEDGNGKPISSEVIAEHVANTVTMVLLRCLCGYEQMTKEEAEDSILHLLN